MQAAHRLVNHQGNRDPLYPLGDFVGKEVDRIGGGQKLAGLVIDALLLCRGAGSQEQAEKEKNCRHFVPWKASFPKSYNNTLLYPRQGNL